MTEKNQQTGGRLHSLDALRGFDMLFIMGFAGLLMKLCVAAGWGKDCFLYTQMRHVGWHGLAFMDTIFPLFLSLACTADTVLVRDFRFLFRIVPVPRSVRALSCRCACVDFGHVSVVISCSIMRAIRSLLGTVKKGKT